jgi:uncharacterized protein (TIGR00369 family)
LSATWVPTTAISSGRTGNIEENPKDLGGLQMDNGKVDEEHFRKLERMYVTAPVNQYFRPVMRVGCGTAEVSIAVRRDFYHAAHAVHGVVYFKLLDDAAFFAANSLVEDVFVLTVSLNSQLLRPVTEGDMKATGRVVHQSKSLIIADAEVLDADGRQLARGTGTFMRSRIPLSPEIGYA